MTTGAAEPPTFADLVVAGGCKSLFYQLYQNDQQRLQEDIQASLRSLAEVEQVLQYEQPAIFAQWQRASEPQKANLRSMFRMIKTYYFNLGRADWNEYRAANYDSIISVMEENLESLKLVRYIAFLFPYAKLTRNVIRTRPSLKRRTWTRSSSSCARRRKRSRASSRTSSDAIAS